MKEYWTDFCVKYTCNGEFLHKTGQKWFVKSNWLPYDSYRITQYYYIMYSDVKGASCVNKIMNYFPQWTNHNTNRDLDL